MHQRAAIIGRRESGEEFPAEVSLAKLETADGLAFTAIVRDLSERRDTEMRLIEHAQELQLARERVAELEAFALDLRIRLTEQEEIAAALRAELATEYDARRNGPLAVLRGRVRGVLRRLRALLLR